MTLAVEIPRERFVLACGAALLVSQRPAASVTAVRVHVRGGPSLDPPGKQGLAYLTGHLSDQGTADHTEEQIAELLEPAGGEISGDSNGLGGTIAGGSWELLVDLVGELLMRPTYPDEPVARQRTRLLSRLQVEREDPRVQGGRLFRKLVYGDHWLGRAAYGTFESVSTITPDDLRAHHRAAWVGNRCVIGVCGNVEPERVRERFEQALAGFAPGEPFVRETPLLPPLAPRAAAFAADRKQVHVYLGHLGIRRQDPDYATLVVMDHVLGTGPGFTNRITRRLRDELGLAYHVSADIHSSAGVLPGTFTAYIGTSPEHVATSVQGFLEEIRRIRDEPVGDEELATAKNYVVGSFPLGYERATRRANHLVSSEIYDFPPDILQRLPREFAAVTPEDVQRVARAHLFPDACCLATAGATSEEELEALLAQAARV